MRIEWGWKPWERRRKKRTYERGGGEERRKKLFWTRFRERFIKVEKDMKRFERDLREKIWYQDRKTWRESKRFGEEIRREDGLGMGKEMHCCCSWLTRPTCQSGGNRLLFKSNQLLLLWFSKMPLFTYINHILGFRNSSFTCSGWWEFIPKNDIKVALLLILDPVLVFQQINDNA